MIQYMLDTNIVIYTIKNRPESVKKRFNQHTGRLCVSSIVAMELMYGAAKSSQPSKNMADIEGMLSLLEVLPFDDVAAMHSGNIRAELESQGRPIGAYDNLIAGHARSQGLILITNNMKEFKRVLGLRIENWV